MSITTAGPRIINDTRKDTPQMIRYSFMGTLFWQIAPVVSGCELSSACLHPALWGVLLVMQLLLGGVH
jgi:hypothetical protein